MGLAFPFTWGANEEHLGGRLASASDLYPAYCICKVNKQGRESTMEHTTNFTSKMILVIEDEPDIANMLILFIVTL